MSLASTLSGYNNPGALTVTSAFDYPGQTGVYQASNELNFAEFGNIQDGTNAITQWLLNNTGTNPSSSYTTVGEAGDAYTGSSTGGQQWANILGVSYNTPISSISNSALVSAITQNEGITNSGNTTSTSTGSSSTSSSNWFQNILNQISAWIGGGLVEVVFIILGIILLLGAIYMFAKDNDMVPNVQLPPIPIE